MCDQYDADFRGYPEDAYESYLEWMGVEDSEGAGVDFEEAYCGEWPSEVEFAMQLAEDLGAVPDDNAVWPLYCIDWSYAVRELFMSDFWFDGRFVFRSV